MAKKRGRVPKSQCNECIDSFRKNGSLTVLRCKRLGLKCSEVTKCPKDNE